MTTIRVERRRRFTTIDRSVANDQRLSFRARGLLVWLLDKPDDWRVNSTQIANHCPEGRDAVRAALAELEQCGYLTRQRVQGSKGRWCTDVVVHETPVTEDGIPGVGQPGVGFPGANTNTDTEDCSPQTPKRKGRETRHYDVAPLTPEQIAAKWGCEA